MASTIRISILADAANAVRGLRNTGSQADRTNAQLVALQRRVDKLDGRNVNIDMKTKGFKDGVAQIIVANLALDRIRAGLPDLSFGLTGVANKVAAIGGAALVATAATLPLIGATVAVGSAFAAAGAGVGLFAAAAVPTIKTVTDAVTQYNTASAAYDKAKALGDTKAATKAQNDMAASLNVLTPTQRAAARGVISLNTAFAGLSNSTAPTVLGIITNAGTTLAKIIPKITPAVTAMGTELGKISSTALTGLSNSVTPIADLITSQGIPSIKNLATIIGNLLPTVGHLVTAFAPLGTTILSKLAPLTGALKSINFDSLATSAGKLLPSVGSLLGNLGGALGNLVKAAAPLAGPVLAGLSSIAGTLKTTLGGPDIALFVTNIGKIVPAVAPIVAVVVPAFAKFAGIISGDLLAVVPKLLPIVKQMADVFVNVLTGLSPLLPALLDLVGVFVSFLPVLYPVIVAFRTAMIPVIGAVSAALAKLQPVFKIAVGAFITLLNPISDLLVALIKIVPVLITDLVPAFVIIVGAAAQVLTAFTPLFPTITKLITAVANGITPVLGTLADALGNALPTAIAIVTPVLTVLTTIISNPLFGKLAIAALAIAAGMKAWSAAQAAVTAVTKVAIIAQQGFQAVYNVGQLTKYVGALVASKAATLAASAASKVAASAQVLFNIALDANPIGLVVIAIGLLVAGFVIAYKNSATFRAVVQGALKAVAGAFSAVVAAAKAVFDFLKDHWKLILAIVTGPIGLIVLYVTTHWDKIRSTIVGGFNAVVSFFTGIPQQFRDIGSNIINGLLAGIDAGISFVRDRVRGLGALIPDWLKEVLGINSPSTETADVAGHTVDGLLVGFDKKIPALKRKLSSVGKTITDGLSVTPTASLSGLSSSVTSSINTGVASANAITLGRVAVNAGAAGTGQNSIRVDNLHVHTLNPDVASGKAVIRAMAAAQRQGGA